MTDPTRDRETFLGLHLTGGLIKRQESYVAPKRIWFSWFCYEGGRKPLFGRSLVNAGGWVLYFHRWQIRYRPYMPPYWIRKRRDGFVDSFFGRGPRTFTKPMDTDAW